MDGVDMISPSSPPCTRLDSRPETSTNIVLPYGSQCARLPLSNSPVTSVSSDSIRCNVGTSPAGKKCTVAAGSTVTVEMHQVRLYLTIQQTSLCS